MATILVCQFCGRTVLKGGTDSRHWLDEDRRGDVGIRVVRCPEHWSEWALRNTYPGRTNAMRARMREALSQPVPAMPAWLSPLPLTEAGKEST